MRDTFLVMLLFLLCAAIPTMVAIAAITWQMRLASALYGG